VIVAVKKEKKRKRVRESVRKKVREKMREEDGRDLKSEKEI